MNADSSTNRSATDTFSARLADALAEAQARRSRAEAAAMSTESATQQPDPFAQRLTRELEKIRCQEGEDDAGQDARRDAEGMPPDLRQVVDAWSTLEDRTKAVVLGFVRFNAWVA